ncbi:hypothetical protein [Streptomyces sp. NPDC127033]|uniref:hypothetical protein n=1 Tax=Streptomyces sp. NPDC127033 TaxID=3347110 RepID=UPI003651448E
MFMSSWKPGRKFGLALMPFLLLTACSGSPETIRIPVSRVVGNWTGPDGEEISFAVDRTFESANLAANELAAEDCPAKRTSGGWAFYAKQGDGMYGTSKEAASGDRIGLSFTGLPEEDCFLDLAVIDGGNTLCATSDPDDPCSLGVRFSREK